MRIKATTYRPVGDKTSIGKSYHVDENGQLEKGDFSLLTSVSAEITEWDDLRAYHDWLLVACTQQVAVTYGVPEKPRGIIFVKGAYSSQKSWFYSNHGINRKEWPAISRAKAEFSFQPRTRIIFAVDSDPTPKMLAAGEWRTEAEVWRQLCLVWPELEGQAYVSAHSASTFLSVDGKQVVGEKGVRVSIDVLLDVDAADGHRGASGERIRGVDVLAFAKILHKRLILAGLFSPYIASHGLFELRTTIDRAIYSPIQPDFVGATTLEDGRVSQSRPKPVFHEGNMEPIRISTIKPLSHDEEAEVARIIDEQKKLHKEECDARRIDNNRKLATNSKAVREGRRTVEEEMDRLWALENKYVSIDHEFTLRDGGVVSGAQIVANPEPYFGAYCTDPFRPHKGTSKAKIIPFTQFGKRVPAILMYMEGRVATFIDDSDIEDLMGVGPTAAGSDHEGREDGETVGPDGGIVYAVEAAAAMRVQDPPPEIMKPSNFPVVPASEAVRAAKEIVADSTDGIKAALGYALETAVSEEFFREKRGTIPVKSYEEAALLIEWINRVSPEKKVMVLPGRAVDAAKMRQEYGIYFLAYRDDDGKLVGTDDVICMKPNLVRALHHDVGMETVAGHTCIKPRRTNELGEVEPEERCEHFSECGKLRRQMAKPRHDIVIETQAALAGTLNPKLESDEPFPADFLLPSAARTTAQGYSWPYREWQQHPELAVFLPFIERCGDAPSFEEVGRGSKGDLERWAAEPAVSPSMTERDALDMVVRWSRLTGKQKGVPTRVETANAIKAWIEGSANISVEGTTVVAAVNVPPRRLEKHTAFILSSSKSTYENMKARYGGTVAAGAGTVTMASKRLLPTKIIQIVPNDDGSDASGDAVRSPNNDGSDVPNWLAKRAKEGTKATADDKLAGSARDLQTLVQEIAIQRGPGIVMAIDGVSRLEFGTDVQVVGFSQMSIIFCGAGKLRPDASWAVVIGHRYPADKMVQEYICSQPKGYWPMSVIRKDGMKVYKSRAVYTKRDGTPHDFVGGSRKTGSDEQTDKALQALIADPVITLAGWLASRGLEAGKDTLLVIVDRYPLVDRNTPMEGVPADMVLRFRDAVPSAGWLLTVVRGMKVDEAAKVLRVQPLTVKRERAAAGQDAAQILELYLGEHDGRAVNDTEGR